MIVEIKSYDNISIEMGVDFFIKNNKITTRNLTYISNIIEDNTEEILFKIIEDDCIKYLNCKNQLHNPNGPAIICFDENGFKRWDEYWIYGKLHNLNGPAGADYDKDGNIKNKSFWINDCLYTEKEFNKVKNEISNRNSKLSKWKFT